MTDSEEGDAARRWAAAARVAKGLQPEAGSSAEREAWALVVVVVVLVAAMSGVTTLLLLQPLFRNVIVVPGWLKTAGVIIECAGILLDVSVWFHAGRTGEKPNSQSLVVAQLSLTQRRRVANQIKGRESVHPEELNVVLAAARQTLILQRFSLRLLPGYLLLALGNLMMWPDLGPAMVLYAFTMILFVVAVPMGLRRLRQTRAFLAFAGTDALNTK
ncbi:hypothetical protein AB0O52_11030 [Arthrobacter sp. NPDC080073]|uniref:hypothetical protein n=1 Tax=Arthrobacter sp. NPDC080073 TaxID=3155919 RepID=UPI0034412334